MAAPTISSVFERLTSSDKDFRYMATSDLTEILKKPDWRRDDDQERRLCDLILQQLDDTSGDVSSLATKCLGLLVRRVHNNQAERILDFLCTRLVSGKKEQDREIASIALKTVINDISSPELSGLAVKQVVPKLLLGMQSKEQPDIAMASLDIMNDVVAQFGPLLGGEHVQLKTILLQELSSTKAGVRKKAITCLGCLVPYLSDALLDDVSLDILKKLQDPGSTSDTRRVLVQALGAIGRAAGWRFGRYLDRAVPLIVEHWKAAGEGDDELRDFCLQALEAFVLRSPLDAKRHLDSIFDVTQQSLCYDPNYADDMEEDTEEDEEEEAMSDDELSDDDDASWKVRRSAAKCLVAIINNYFDLLTSLYPKVSPLVVSRFKEREENVKIDIFNVFIALLHQVATAANRDRAYQAYIQLQADSSEVLKAAFKQLRDKSLKTRAGVLLTLKELISIVPKCLSHDVEQLLPGLTAALSDRSSNSSQLRIQALQFLSVALEKSDPEVWRPHVAALSEPILAAVGERYSKVSAEGLRVCEALVHVIRPNLSNTIPSSLKSVLSTVLTAVRERLSAQDQDQEVKECAVSCTAFSVATVGDSLHADVPGLLQILLERLRNETTRITAVKAFMKIAESPLGLDLSPVLEPLLAELTSYLRKSNRHLRQVSLAALEAAMSRQGAQASSASVTAAVDEVVGLVSDTDLLTTPLALHFCLTVLTQQPQNAAQIAAKFLPAALRLVKSPLLQGAALEELLALFPAVLASSGTNVSFDSLLSSLLAAGVAAETGKAAQHSVAQCLARMTIAAGSNHISAVVKGLLGQVQTGNVSWSVNGMESRGRKRSATEESTPGGENARRLALLSIGEIGRCADLSAFPQLQQALTHALTSQSEEIKAAASLALGAVSIGNLDTYLPFVIQQINDQASNPKDQYLLLKALNEVLMSLTSDMGNKQLAPTHQQEVLGLLLANCEVEEECRNVVAECMGHLALLFPAEVLPALLQRHSDPSPSARAAAVTAIKAAVVSEPHPIDDLLKNSIGPFLDLVSDPDRGVRKAAVQMLSSAAHNKAALVADALPGVMPRVYAQTVIDPSLIRTVDLGPFKHKIDDGLELRKAAFEAMDVLLDTCVDRLDFHAFVSHLESGLKDHYDVKLPCHLLLAKLASAAPGQLLSALDRLVDPLEKTLTARIKSDAVKQEVDRNEDMIRSALRAVDAITRIPSVDSCPPFKVLMNNVILTGPLAEKYKAVRDERAEAEGTAPVK